MSSDFSRNTLLPKRKIARFAFGFFLFPTMAMAQANLGANFTRSLKYPDVEESPGWEISYDLESSNGQSLVMGPMILNEKTLTFSLAPVSEILPSTSLVLQEKAKSYSLNLVWPEALFATGNLEMISRRGDVIWKYEITKAKLKEWSELKQEILNKSPKGSDSNPFFSINLAIRNFKSAGFPLGTKDSFRFCLSQEKDQATSRVCSAQMAFRRVNKVLNIGRLKSENQGRVLFNGEAAKLKDTIPVASDKMNSFYVDLNSGISYEFFSMPPKDKVSDVRNTKDPNVFVVQGWDLPPAGVYKILNPDQYGKVTKLIGFEDTIGDFRKFWKTEMKADDPFVFIPSDGGGLFRRKINLNGAPNIESRPLLAKDTVKNTYLSEVVLRGRKPSAVQVSSSQNSVSIDSSNDQDFQWKFASPELNRINRSYLSIEADGRVYKSYYEIFRAYGNEISGRLTGVGGTGSVIVFAELAYNHWFESIGGWQNDLWSRHRWGINSKYFQSLSQIPTNSPNKSGTLTVLTVDGKYRFKAGMWGRDETVGAIVSYQSVSFDPVAAPMLGVGTFWARSMPRVFDDMFNYFSIFRFPKWVDMEFIYYAYSPSSNIALNSPLALNFHGQVMWTDGFFGEAGFGLKRYAFVDRSVNQIVGLNTFYSTIGIGYKF